MRRLLILVALASIIRAEDLPLGQIIDSVKCQADASQGYALYLPSHYSPERLWKLILAFDPRARGRVPVERFQAAAETYGYIVAGSNNSSNGSWQGSMVAVQAMSADLGSRFNIDGKRVYTAGLSGGARVAMEVALATHRIAGVIASSAGYPDATVRKTVPFAVFATAGTEDFNYLEMRQLDRALTTPHHLAIFEGGHTWLSSELAVEAVEWMEIAAMRSGLSPKDEALIGRLFAKRAAQAKEYPALAALIADFTGLRDVSEYASRESAMRQTKAVKDALKRERADEQREEQILREFAEAESGLTDQDRRTASLAQLRIRLADLSRKSEAASDTSDRRLARRVLRGVIASSVERAKDPEYKKLIDQYRPAVRPFQ